MVKIKAKSNFILYLNYRRIYFQEMAVTKESLITLTHLEIKGLKEMKTCSKKISKDSELELISKNKNRWNNN